MARITLNDVAEKAGVAKSVASKVLRSLPEAAKYLPETRQRVFDTANALNYRPNFFASQLMPGKQKILALGLHYLEDSYASVIAQAFENRAREKGFEVMLSVLHGETDVAKHGRSVVGSNGVTKAAYIGEISDAAQEALVREGVNVVLIGRKSSNSHVSTVTADRYSGGLAIVKHLHDQGIKKLLLLPCSPPGSKVSEAEIDRDERIAAVLDFARANGLPKPRIRVLPLPPGALQSNETIGYIYDFLKHNILAENADIEGILAFSDTVALAVIAALNHLGRRAGHDVAVVGYDDCWHSSISVPPITTVYQPRKEMGQMAADWLIDAGTHPETLHRKKGAEPTGSSQSANLWPQKIVLPVKLIVRASSMIQKQL